VQELEIVIKTIQAHATRMQQEAEQLSAERLVNETLETDRRRLNSVFKDIRSTQYHIEDNFPFKPQ